MITCDDMRPYIDKRRREREELDKKCLELRQKELAAKGLKLIEKDDLPQKDFHGNCDHPNTMDDTAATILYIVVMLGGLIFNDRILIWIVATIIYVGFRNRHKK